MQRVHKKARSYTGVYAERQPDNPWSFTNEISLTLRFLIQHGRKSKSVCTCIHAFVGELINMYVCVSYPLSQHSVHVAAVQPTDHYHSFRSYRPSATPGSLSVPNRWVFPWEPWSPLYLSDVNKSSGFNISIQHTIWRACGRTTRDTRDAATLVVSHKMTN